MLLVLVIRNTVLCYSHMFESFNVSRLHTCLFVSFMILTPALYINHISLAFLPHADSNSTHTHKAPYLIYS